MVRIPLPSVPQQPVSNGRFVAPSVVPPQDATGRQLAGLGEGVQGLGFEMSRRADWQQDQLERAQFDEADNLTADAVRDVKMGYRALIGRDATGNARKKAEEDLDKRIAKIGESLSPSLQERWKPRADARRAAAVESMAGHETDQTLAYRIGGLEAGIKASRIDGLKPEMVRQAKELSKLLGEDETQERMRVLGETTQYHEERIRILAKSNPDAAAQMLTEAREAKEINPARLDELQGVVEQGQGRKKSDADDEKALTLFASIRDEVTKSDVPLSDQKQSALAILEATRTGKKLSADVWERATRLIDHHFAQQHELRNQQRAETLQAVETIFSKPENKALTPETLPQEMREQADRLGIGGDVYQTWTQVRARQLAEDRRDFRDLQMEFDIKTAGILQKSIEYHREMEPNPAEKDADEKTKAAATEAFSKWQTKLASLQAMHQALSERITDKVGAELPSAPPPKPTSGPKKSTEEKLRDLSKAIRESQGR